MKHYEEHPVNDKAQTQPNMSKRQFLKQGTRMAQASVVAWYVSPAIEILLNPSEAMAQGTSPCPPDQCTPLFADIPDNNDCDPMLNSA